MVTTTTEPRAQAGTGLSPEWDRWFDEAFTDLVCSDEELVRDEFDALIRASWRPPAAPAPPAPFPAEPPDHGRAERRSADPDDTEPEARQPP